MDVINYSSECNSKINQRRPCLIENVLWLNLPNSWLWDILRDWSTCLQISFAGLFRAAVCRGRDRKSYQKMKMMRMGRLHKIEIKILIFKIFFFKNIHKPLISLGQYYIEININNIIQHLFSQNKIKTFGWNWDPNAEYSACRENITYEVARKR